MRWLSALAVPVVALALALPAAQAHPVAAKHPTTTNFLATAQQGLQSVRTHWWNSSADWYNDTYNAQPPSMPLARLWSAYPLFETYIGVAMAEPTAANKQALTTFANAAAKLYWDGNVKPVGGYSWYPNTHSATENIYYDDSGWWGLAFIDAYGVTHNKAYLTAAKRALQFIVGSGWDTKNGGTWWDTSHLHKTIEPLAAGVMIGTRLYEIDHDTWALGWAKKMLTWANDHSFDTKRGVYQRSATDGTDMDYVQGLMVTAQYELCKTLKQPAMCTKAKQVANASLAAFGQNLNWAPMYDVVYLQWMLEYYKESGDARFYTLATHNGQRALAAVNESGYYLNKWDGTVLADGLGEEASNLELFAWIAAVPSPSSKPS